MNETKLKLFKKLIEAKLSELTQEDTLGRESQSVVTLDQQSVGRLSRMDALQSQAMAKAQQGRRDILAQRLRAALARLDSGDFGECEDCGEWIAPKRLEFDPAATKCISCASG
ncbi:MAG: TraR/DksA C4-type zinc finger protein [Paracoccaceae bacterium]